MAMQLFDTLKPDQTSDGPQPNTDGQARIILDADEIMDCSVFLAQGAQTFYQSPDNGAWECCYKPTHSVGLAYSDDLVYDMGWTLTLTPSRLLIWSPLSTGGLLGVMGLSKMKMNPGKSTGGQVRYAWIDEFSAASGYALEFKVDNSPDSHIKSMLLKIGFASNAEAQTFASALASRLTTYQATKGADMTRVGPELDKLSTYDWDKPSGGLSISVLRAGGKVQYTS